MPRTSIVVPCYNEAARLPAARFLEAVDRDPLVDFLLVDDGSTDGTSAVLTKLAAEQPGRIARCELPANCGKAEAVRRGVLAAIRTRPAFVGFWDADLATPLDEVPRFRAVLERRSEVQVVIGTRLPLLGRRILRRRTRMWLGRLFARVASRVVGLPIVDTQCGAKLFRVTPEIEGLFAEPFLSRWIFDVELLARLVSARRSMAELGAAALPAARDAIYELPLEQWQDVAGSKLKGRDFLRAIFELAAIRRRYFGRDANSGGRRTAQPVSGDVRPAGSGRSADDIRPQEERRAA